VPVARATNLTRALESYRSAGFFIVGLDGGGSTAVADLDVSEGPLVLVVGSEGKGLSRLVRETCDVIASIPIAASTESLNAGVATGIALYEVARLRRTKP
jgi:23S rRNA (guanosine2251-2'-O)-methyltransferase